jgi:hypothetical protein
VPENPAAWDDGSLALVRRVVEPDVFLLASASPPPVSCGWRGVVLWHRRKPPRVWRRVLMVGGWACC